MSMITHKFESGLVGGTISMITGLTLLDIIEAIVVIAALIAAQHKIRTIAGNMEFNWTRFIPRLTWFAPVPQEMIELPVTSVDNLDAGEIVEQQTNDVQPLEPQEIVEPPIVISGQAGNPSRIRWKIFPDLSSNFETRNALQQ
ncbi:hypothetical protein Fcan01_10092, partial [Folsomia candida]